MDAKPLDWLLDTLAKADTHLPEDDRAACERVADALRHRLTGFSGPIRVVLVTGPDADWLTQEVEWLTQSLDDALFNGRILAGQLETLLDEVRVRRQRITAERDELAEKFKTAHEAGDALWSELGAARDVLRLLLHPDDERYRYELETPEDPKRWVKIDNVTSAWEVLREVTPAEREAITKAADGD